jgi:hypothetical protein
VAGGCDSGSIIVNCQLSIVNCQFVIRNSLYIKQIVARNPFPSFGGVPEGRGGPQNENEIDNEYGVNCQLSIVNCQCRFRGAHIFLTAEDAEVNRRERRSTWDCVCISWHVL